MEVTRNPQQAVSRNDATTGASSTSINKVLFTKRHQRIQGLEFSPWIHKRAKTSNQNRFDGKVSSSIQLEMDQMCSANQSQEWPDPCS